MAINFYFYKFIAHFCLSSNADAIYVTSNIEYCCENISNIMELLSCFTVCMKMMQSGCTTIIKPLRYM